MNLEFAKNVKKQGSSSLFKTLELCFVLIEFFKVIVFETWM
jgi:hypothetical protein